MEIICFESDININVKKMGGVKISKMSEDILSTLGRRTPVDSRSIDDGIIQLHYWSSLQNVLC